MDSNQIHARQAKLFQGIEGSDLDGVVLTPGPSFRYFTGLDFHLSERPIVAWFMARGSIGFVLPEFESEKLNGMGFESTSVTYGENPASWGEAFGSLSAALGLERSRIGAEPRGMRMLESGYIEAAAEGIRLVSAESLVSGIKVRKDESEISSLREAVAFAQKALLNTLPQIQTGMTELKVAGLLTSETLEAGSDPQLPFSPIVGFGPNSALPHHFPTDRRLAEKDIILIDWGASKDGYSADLTRVFAAGEDLEPYQDVARIVAEANAVARRASGPGVEASLVDKSARDVIDAAGMGANFTHRTGHGLGLEGHEPPYIRGDNNEQLEPGMVFTIEPGIYFPGRYGVRIEDDIVVTQEGAESLTSLPREITRLSDYRR
ncbi:MAG TPA: Xaa-Pro peptidase family protein [Anaerolineales bacterium]|nr:Xaa-Pro peptidase family protein [Anaerolineales bacterium]